MQSNKVAIGRSGFSGSLKFMLRYGIHTRISPIGHNYRAVDKRRFFGEKKTRHRRNFFWSSKTAERGNPPGHVEDFICIHYSANPSGSYRLYTTAFGTYSICMGFYEIMDRRFGCRVGARPEGTDKSFRAGYGYNRSALVQLGF